MFKGQCMPRFCQDFDYIEIWIYKMIEWIINILLLNENIKHKIKNFISFIVKKNNNKCIK